MGDNSTRISREFRKQYRHHQVFIKATPTHPTHAKLNIISSYINSCIVLHINTPSPRILEPFNVYSQRSRFKRCRFFKAVWYKRLLSASKGNTYIYTAYTSYMVYGWILNAYPALVGFDLVRDKCGKH